VEARDLPVAMEYLGQTAASRDIEIRARVSGFLETRHFEEGAMVDAGQLLFTIDPKPLNALKVAAQAEVAVAKARVAQADREAQRLAPLVAEEAITARERDDAVSNAEIAAASLAAAEARLAQIELDLGYTKVGAPIAGKIGRALREEGSLIDASGAGGLLTTLVQLDPIYVEFQRSDNEQFELEADIASGRIALPEGGRLQVELRHRHGELLAEGGHIDFTAGTLDRRTGSIPMRASLRNPGQSLLAGQAVRVVLRGAVLRDAIAIPQRAVMESPQGKQVMVVTMPSSGGTPQPTGKAQAAGKAQARGPVAMPRLVKVGEWVDIPDPAGGAIERAWIILEGLQAGDQVIVDNLIKLRPGAPVVVDNGAKAQ